MMTGREQGATSTVSRSHILQESKMKTQLLTTLVAAGVMAGSMATAFAAQPKKMKMTTENPK